jgi:sugar lactone lactonase YvrE
VGKSGDLLRYYTLALSSNGTTLYAANAALGTVSTISLFDDFFDDHSSNTVHFDPGSVRVTNEEKTRMLHNGAALSSDQQTLYVVGIQGIWALDASALQLRGQYAPSEAFTGVALYHATRHKRAGGLSATTSSRR